MYSHGDSGKNDDRLIMWKWRWQAWDVFYYFKTLHKEKTEGIILKNTVKNVYKGGKTMKVVLKSWRLV